MNSLRLGQRNGVVSVAFEKALKHCAIHCIVPRKDYDCDCLYFFLLACSLRRTAAMLLIHSDSTYNCFLGVV